VPATRMKSSVFVPPHSTLNTVNSYGVVKPPAVPSAVFKIDKAAQYSTNHNTAPSNSVAPSTKTTQPLRPPTSSMPFQDKLARLVKNNSLGDINYQNVPTKSGKFIGTVAVAKKKFSSYPEEFSKIEDAYEFAARDAYSHLESTTIGKELPVTDDPKLITQRVIDIVGTSATGCWSLSLVEKYAKDFNERLPANWVQIVSQVTNNIRFEAVTENYLVFPTTQDNTKHSTGRKVLIQKDTDTVDPALYIEEMEPIPASLPESGTLLVHVLVVHAADRVALRHLDSELYQRWEEMCNDMEIFYTDKESALPHVKKLNYNILYAAKVDGTWLRIQLHSIIDDTKVKVVLVDYADIEDNVPITNVYPLLTQFGHIPCQGMMCHLHGLSPFAVSDVAIETEIELFLNQQFIAQVVTKEPQVSLILYETSGGREINMNEKILTKVAEKTSAVSLQVGLVPEVFLSYVSSTGDLFILRDTPQQDVVDALVSMISLHIDNFAVEKNLAPGRMYLGRSPKHDWCRMALCGNISQDGTVAVHLLDFGEVEIVPGNTLRDMTNLSPVLTRIPAQATRVRLSRVPPSPLLSFTEKAAQRLREMAPPSSCLMMRVCEIQQLTGTPVVELYERLENQKLVYINASLEMDDSLFRPINSSNTSTPATTPSSTTPVSPKRHLATDEQLLSRQFASITRTFTTNTMQPHEPVVRRMEVRQVIVPDLEMPLAERGRNKIRFDVHVCNVSNPRLFYVQPLSSLNKLSHLMHKLQEVKKNPDVEKTNLDASSVLENGFYAGWHNKTQLYHRVQVKQKVGTDYLIHFIDYGDNEVVSLSYLLPLPDECSSLPAQAVKAQLFGVKPIDNDWSVEDALYFKELVDGKDFCCYVMDVLPEKKILLRMIDVSGKDDKILSRTLIDARHALPA